MFALQLHPGTFADIQRMQKEWGAYAHYDGPCTQHHCIYHIKLDDLFRWWSDMHPDREGNHYLFWLRVSKLYALFGGHPAGAFANLLVRDNRMWGEDFSVGVETYPGTGRNKGDAYDVVAVIGSGTRLTRRHESSQTKTLRQGFRATLEMNCLGCEEVSVYLTQQTAPEDIDRFNRLNLSCITRWHACRHPDELAPTLWKQAVHDKAFEAGAYDESDPEVCTLSPSILARETTDIALVKVLSVKTVRGSGTATGSQRAFVRVLQALKNGRLYQITELAQFTAPPGSIRQEQGDDAAHLIEGEEYFFLYREPRPYEIDNFLSLEPCHGLLASPQNKALIQRGIELDPSAGEPYDYWNAPYPGS